MIFYILIVLALIAWGAALSWKWKSVRDFSGEVLAAKKRDGELPESITEDMFRDLYVRSEGPRGQTYFFACAATLFLLLGPFVAAFNSVWKMFWMMSGQSPVFETGTLVHTFMVFLAFMGACIALLAAAMRRYYALTPPNLKQVLRDLNGAVK
ncbi:MAG: hypothetical protein R3C13_05245 [Hyphomonas sp.]|uniref:hypothetical protein n=1 Tax=Hyphomonas sp. TaxID=87 RepID=UPI003528C043